MPIRMECAPAFDYARARHETDFVADTSVVPTDQTKVVFKSEQLSLDLRYVADGADSIQPPAVKLKPLDLSKQGHLGLAACADIDMYDGQVVTFVLRIPPRHETLDDRRPTKEQIQQLGIPLEGGASMYISEVYLIALHLVVIKGAQKLRSKEDPVLTDVRWATSV